MRSHWYPSSDACFVVTSIGKGLSSILGGGEEVQVRVVSVRFRLGFIKFKVMVKPDIATKVNLALKFFTALIIDDDEEALCLLKSASFDPTGMQSLKAKEFVDSGV